jgi:hypothetical protein
MTSPARERWVAAKVVRAIFKLGDGPLKGYQFIEEIDIAAEIIRDALAEADLTRGIVSPIQAVYPGESSDSTATPPPAGGVRQYGDDARLDCSDMDEATDAEIRRKLKAGGVGYEAIGVFIRCEPKTVDAPSSVILLFDRVTTLVEARTALGQGEGGR